MANSIIDEDWVSKLSKKDAKELLQKWREENVRCSEKVIEIWENMDLERYLGDEKWQVLEQVCIAAIDLYRDDIMKWCIKELDKKFPNSMRVKRLKMMATFELHEAFEEAQKRYNMLIGKDESNSLLKKRKIAMLVAERRTGDAIRELSEYLKTFMNDQEAWLELCDLYVQEQEYGKAAYCMEELILANPHNHLYHERYAEIQYTINSAESLELARSYFSQALRLNATNLRALHGLILTTNSLSNLVRCTSQKKKENQKLSQWASQQVAKMYQESDANQLVIGQIDTMFSSLQVN